MKWKPIGLQNKQLNSNHIWLGTLVLMMVSVIIYSLYLNFSLSFGLSAIFNPDFLSNINYTGYIMNGKYTFLDFQVNDIKWWLDNKQLYRDT